MARADAEREALPAAPQRMPGGQWLALAVAATALSLGREVLAPLAVAILLAFALSPLVTRVRNRGLSLTLSVVSVVTATGIVLAAFAFLVFGQLAQLAENLPTFRENIVAKVESLKETGGQGSLISRLSDMGAAIGAQLEHALPAGNAAPPMPVEVVNRTTPWELTTNLILPAAGPLGTAGLVIILVVFMLLEREDLLERLIRLLGPGDLHRSTQLLDEAGSRVGMYLLTQLLVNIIYAVPVAFGLWIIGVPQALLWGMLTLVMRFVPYIGAILSAGFPMLLAFAISPGWSMVLWTIELYAVVEFITSNVIEPWAYGSRTGVSPLAIIIAAMVWTFLWGPLGLVLSTPLTVCLVVLGRHIPQFQIFDILLGDAPVLAPHARLYQRLLTGDLTEASARAEVALEDEDLDDFWQTSLLPALILAQDDRDRGRLTAEQERVMAATASTLAADLAADDAAEEEAPAAPTDARFAVVGGRWELDDVTAEVLAHDLQAAGIAAEARPARSLAPARVAEMLEGRDGVILCFLDPEPSRASLLHISRLKRARKGLRVGVVIWDLPGSLRGAPGEIQHLPAPASAAKLAEARELGADFAVTTLVAARDAALSAEPALPPPESRRRRRRVPA